MIVSANLERVAKKIYKQVSKFRKKGWFSKDISEFLIRKYADKKMRTVVKAARHRAKSIQLLEALKITDLELYNALHFDSDICRDIRSGFMKYHSITKPQETLVRNILNDIVPNWVKEKREREKQWAEDQEKALPIPEGRFEVKATVLSFKSVESDYGTTLKMLVRHSDGWKAFGTVPAFFEGDKGDTIIFNATFQKSKDDEKFGFFKRPTAPKKNKNLAQVELKLSV